MEKFDDISNLTYLNEASVLWNLKARYVAKLIYVSSTSFMYSRVNKICDKFYTKNWTSELKNDTRK